MGAYHFYDMLPRTLKDIQSRSCARHLKPGRNQLGKDAPVTGCAATGELQRTSGHCSRIMLVTASGVDVNGNVSRRCRRYVGLNHTTT